MSISEQRYDFEVLRMPILVNGRAQKSEKRGALQILTTGLMTSSANTMSLVSTIFFNQSERIHTGDRKRLWCACSFAKD